MTSNLINHNPSCRLNPRLRLTALAMVFMGLSTPISYAAENSPPPSDVNTIEVFGQYPSAYNSHYNTNNLTFRMIANERDLLRDEVGVTVGEGGRAGSDGFTMRGVDGNRVAYSVDGVAAVDSYKPVKIYAVGLYNGNRNGFEIEDMHSVSIDKGADSTQSGSGALGGTVLLQTKTIDDILLPQHKIGFYTKQAYESRNDEYRQVYGLGWRFGPVSSLFVQVTHRHSHEMKNYKYDKALDVFARARGVPDPQNFHSTTVLSKLQLAAPWNPQDIIEAQLESTDMHRKINEKSFYGLDPTHTRWTTDSTPYYRYGMRYIHQSDKLGTFTLRWMHQNVKQLSGFKEYYGKLPLYQGYPDLSYTLAQYQSSDSQQSSNLYDLKWVSNPLMIGNQEHQLTVTPFVKYSRFRQSVSGSNYTTPVMFLEPINSTNWGLSINDNFAWNDRLDTSVGLRYEHASYRPQASMTPLIVESNTDYTRSTPRRFAALSGRLNLQYNVNPNMEAGYSFSTGYRFPTVEELFHHDNRGGVWVVSNPHLKQETAFSHELSLNYHNNWSSTTLGLFYTKYKNYIGFNLGSETTTTWNNLYEKWETDTHHVIKYSNVANAYTYGVELISLLSGNVIHLPHWYASWKLSYADGKRSDHTSLFAIQPFTTNMGIGYRKGGWNVLFTGQYVAKKPSDQLYYNKFSVGHETLTREKLLFPNQPYWVFDLTAQYQYNKHIKINAGVFNLFNRQYYTWDKLRQLTFSTENVWYDGSGVKRYSEPGRNYAVSVEMKF